MSAGLLVEAGFDRVVAEEFIAHKSRLKAPLTERAWADHQREAAKAGWSVVDAAEKVMAKGWKGFEAAYVGVKSAPGRAISSGRSGTDRGAALERALGFNTEDTIDA